jgi:hypothetical protein
MQDAACTAAVVAVVVVVVAAVETASESEFVDIHPGIHHGHVLFLVIRMSFVKRNVVVVVVMAVFRYLVH